MPTWSKTDVALYEMKRKPIPLEKIQAKQDAIAEKELHKIAVSWLRLQGVKCIVDSRMDRATTQAKGVADLLLAVKGRPVAIELKVGSNQPTDEQWAWLADARADGWVTGVCRSLEEVIQVYKSAQEEGAEEGQIQEHP